MLFNSYEFIFFYLPVVFIGFFFIARHSQSVAALWLAAASLFFYGWWNPTFVLLLLASIGFNYSAGYVISRALSSPKAKWILSLSIAANLALLGTFKYANFFIETANTAGADWHNLDLVLPLGISFFTFTQIAYLVDVYRGIVRESNFIHYLLFVTWFPHLIAGPVLHHKQMMPQFSLPGTYQPNAEAIAVGLTLFSVGLFKKVGLADQFALFANHVFDTAMKGGHPTFFEAWIGTLAYTLQLYFDFSGYSDMAIGLSRIFNVKLPLNFDSPYKATDIIDFWRRWHMTLSKFLRDYLYIPLGGNRKGPVRRHMNLMITMLLGGLWHGAGWNFVLWGGLHGVFLVINHGWQKITGSTQKTNNQFSKVAGIFLTFTVVVIAWVPFRAANLEATIDLWSGMAGLNGISLPTPFAGKLENYLGNFVTFSGINLGGAVNVVEAAFWIPVGLCIVWFLPNTQQWLGNFSPACENVSVTHRFAWRPNRLFAVLIGILFAFSVLLFKKNSPFLYFQF